MVDPEQVLDVVARFNVTGRQNLRKRFQALNFDLPDIGEWFISAPLNGQQQQTSLRDLKIIQVEQQQVFIGWLTLVEDREDGPKHSEYIHIVGVDLQTGGVTAKESDFVVSRDGQVIFINGIESAKLALTKEGGKLVKVSIVTENGESVLSDFSPDDFLDLKESSPEVEEGMILAL